jgi:hypothetical protein
MMIRTFHMRFAIMGTAGAMFLASCLGPSQSDRIGEVRSDLVLLMEGKDPDAILRHFPGDPSHVKISMNSGGYSVSPETIHELEEALDEFRLVFNGDSIDLTQEKVDIEGDTARVSLTFRVSEDAWDRVIPVRMDLEHEGDRWVLRGLHAFD